MSLALPVLGIVTALMAGIYKIQNRREKIKSVEDNRNDEMEIE